MITYSDFKKTFLEEVYSRTPISQHIVENFYQQFKTTIEFINSSVKDSFKESSLNFDTFIQTQHYYDVIEEALNQYIHEELKEKNLKKDGFCLKSTILNRACCLVLNKNIVGIVKAIDEHNPRFLIVDFGEKDVHDRKVDIDELIIA